MAHDDKAQEKEKQVRDLGLKVKRTWYERWPHGDYVLHFEFEEPLTDTELATFDEFYKKEKPIKSEEGVHVVHRVGTFRPTLGEPEP